MPGRTYPLYVVVPDPYRAHPLLADSVFYTLPVSLLEHAANVCGRKLFGDLLEMDLTLSNALEHNERLVGYRNGAAFSHDLLAQNDVPLPKIDDQTLAEWGMTRAQVEEQLRAADERSHWYRTALRGYAGWLLTNRQFLGERDDLFARWSTQIKKDGIPQTGPTFFGNVPHLDLFRRIRSVDTKGFLEDFARFYARWRLMHLATRELPEPLAPQVPLLTPVALLTHMDVGGVAFYQPDTIPIPPREQLRDMLEEIRTHAQQQDHLREWLRIVGRGRHSNHRIEGYAQIFTLQHYWTVLANRYPHVIAGNTMKLQDAFAAYLHVSPQAVDKYRRRIRKRLGGG